MSGDAVQFWIAVGGLTCSVLAFLISLSALALSRVARRRPNSFSVAALLFGIAGAPLNAYHVWRLWP